MMEIGKDERRVLVLLDALYARQRDLESRKRLPRGYTIKDYNAEIEILAAEIAKLDCERFAAMAQPELDLTNGVG